MRALTGLGSCAIPRTRVIRPAPICEPSDSRMLCSIPSTGTYTKHGACRRDVRSWLCVSLAVLFIMSGPALAKSKAPRPPRPEPDLKILEFKITPTPYSVAAGNLEFSAVVQLPKDLDGATLLEVSSLVTSPSKTSIRFLSTRKPLDDHDIPAATPTEFPRLPIVLTWDGMDHQKMPAGAGLYHYEMRAKLLANGEKGPRTLMVSWPKRGTVEVK